MKDDPSASALPGATCVPCQGKGRRNGPGGWYVCMECGGTGRVASAKPTAGPPIASAAALPLSAEERAQRILRNYRDERHCLSLGDWLAKEVREAEAARDAEWRRAVREIYGTWPDYLPEGTPLRTLLGAAKPTQDRGGT